MKTFTPTQLRDNSGAVYNEVMIGGPVSIKGKSRPEMLLMTVDQFKHNLEMAMVSGLTPNIEALKQQESNQ